jgi:hypothetical protein
MIGVTWAAFQANLPVPHLHLRDAGGPPHNAWMLKTSCLETASAMPQVPRFALLSEGLRAGDFAAVPADWELLLTDIESSGQAIEKGRYKMVNALGAACIIAACNAAGRDDLPYVFGGDGACLLAPPECAPRIEAALRSLQAHAHRALGLSMRVGWVSIAQVRAAGADVRLGWHERANAPSWACLIGGGLRWAEAWMKSRPSDLSPAETSSTNSEEVVCSLEGLECRWNDIPSRHGRIVSLLVEPLQGDPRALAPVAAWIESLGAAALPPSAHPMPIAWPPRHLAVESRLRSRSRWAWRWRWWGLLSFTALLWPLMRATVSRPDSAAGRYTRSLAVHADHLKLDDGLRAVVDLDAQQIVELRVLLDQLEQRGDIVYGWHDSDRAVMTCFVRSLTKHAHFIDAGDGGYAKASAQLKAKSAVATATEAQRPLEQLPGSSVRSPSGSIGL